MRRPPAELYGPAVLCNATAGSFTVCDVAIWGNSLAAGESGTEPLTFPAWWGAGAAAGGGAGAGATDTAAGARYCRCTSQRTPGRPETALSRPTADSPTARRNNQPQPAAGNASFRTTNVIAFITYLWVLFSLARLCHRATGFSFFNSLADKERAVTLTSRYEWVPAGFIRWGKVIRIDPSYSNEPHKSGHQLR